MNCQDEYLNSPITKYMRTVYDTCSLIDEYYEFGLNKSGKPVDKTTHVICREKVFMAQEAFTDLPNGVLARHLDCDYVYT